MNVKLTMLAVLSSLALPLSAQTKSTCQVVGPASKTNFEKSASTGWFVTLQGGVQMMSLKANENAKLSDRITFMPTVSVGKFWNPYFATRIQGDMGTSKTFNFLGEKQTNKFVGGHLDFMFDLVNFFADYKPCRVFHILPFVGGGYEYKYDHEISKGNGYMSDNTLTGNGGLQLAINFSRRVGLVAEYMATYTNYPYKNPYPKCFYNGLRQSLTAGLNVKLGKTNFATVTPMDYALINNLNKQISDLRAENSELAKRPEKCPKCPEVSNEVQIKGSFLTQKAVLFRYGRSNVSKDQLIHLFDAAQFVNKDNGALLITGYIEKSERRIKGLAEKRAEAVAKILTEQYNVPSDKITVEWKDANDVAYKDARAWNRVVVIRSK